MSNTQAYLCIHGHFYQPPRENAWLEVIEEQFSAHPHHDWNERIYLECYRPNSKARVLDTKGAIVQLVNNFEFISFNFGPTLLSWLEEKFPETYREILAADQRSLARHDGHGNALAQVYNHMIMPLANRRDKVTQVKWGMEDFRRRFGREAEGIWLAETACNNETLEVLIEEGVRFIILAPHQAETVRPLGHAHAHWQDVSSGQIDPRQPYRFFLKHNTEKYIDIFFYDGPISKAISFEDVLTNADHFMARIDMARIREYPGPQLIHVATDGETYGHHKVFGDRVLAYILASEAARRGYQVTNYSAYLAAYPPKFEVRIKEGEHGGGTSWSCPHGVRRWKDHCGCRGDGPADWTQHWRKPLRESLDWLRDELGKIYENECGRYLKDVWAARNSFIQVVLDRSENTVRTFLEQQGKETLDKDARVRILKLLEMQRQAMLMYTSCAWFFTELSGIETVQVIQYAARAIQLAEEISGTSLEAPFVDRLALARSNVPAYGDGRGVYEKLVGPRKMSLRMVAGLYAIGAMIEGMYAREQDTIHLYCYRVEVLYEHLETFGDVTMHVGCVRVFSRITWEEETFVYLVAQVGALEFRCSIKPAADAGEAEALEKEFLHPVSDLQVVELFRKMDERFGPDYLALKDLPFEERKRILAALTRQRIDEIGVIHENIFDNNRRMADLYRAMSLPIPQSIRYAAEHTLSRRMIKSLMELSGHDFNLRRARSVYQVAQMAKRFDIVLDGGVVSDFLSEALLARVRRLSAKQDFSQIAVALNILHVAKKIEMEPHHWKVQDCLFDALEAWSKEPALLLRAEPVLFEQLMQLIKFLNINPDAFKKKFQRDVPVA